MTKILASLLLLVVVASILASCSCPCNDEPIPEPTPAPTVNERLDTLEVIMRANVPNYNSAAEWADRLSDTYRSLRNEWRESSGFDGLIRVDGVDVFRARILLWREEFSGWVEDVDRRLTLLSASNDNYEFLQRLRARGLRILENVDAILETAKTP